jgi:hypothetical protein
MILKIGDLKFEGKDFSCQLTIDGGADVSLSVDLIHKEFFLDLYDNRSKFMIFSNKWILDNCKIKILDLSNNLINLGIRVDNFKIKTLQEQRDDIIDDILN